jgi:hypothetical protein
LSEKDGFVVIFVWLCPRSFFMFNRLLKQAIALFVLVVCIRTTQKNATVHRDWGVHDGGTDGADSDRFSGHVSGFSIRRVFFVVVILVIFVPNSLCCLQTLLHDGFSEQQQPMGSAYHKGHDTVFLPNAARMTRSSFRQWMEDFEEKLNDAGSCAAKSFFDFIPWYLGQAVRDN